jgi:hypothetical protein
MVDLRSLHREAMEIAERGFIARRSGEYAIAIQLFADAFDRELNVAQMASKEPSRSVFFRSAATLALHAQLYREAEKAVGLGLAGDTPPEIAEELREVYERVNFHRHLQLNGLQLSNHEIQFSITGNAIAQGMALVGAVINRVQVLEKIFIRAAQRINNRPFKKLNSGELYNLYISPPRVNSFAVTLTLGEPEQLQMFDNRTQVIDEVLYNFELLNEKRFEDLEQTIPEIEYRESFLGLSKNLAPDGKAVRMVGMTTTRNGTETSVGLSVTPKEIGPAIVSMTQTTKSESDAENFQLEGEMLYAEAIANNKIKIVDDSGKKHTILVSKAFAEDVVRPYFGTRVIADVTQVNAKTLVLRDITPAT